jgi:hypothetical protein
MILESFDCFFSGFSWASLHEAEALSFSLMMDAASYDDIDDLDLGVVCWFSVLEDMALMVVMVKGRGMVAMLAWCSVLDG